jgi:hypothetical protein
MTSHNTQNALFDIKTSLLHQKMHPTVRALVKTGSSVKQILHNVFDQILINSDIDFIVTLEHHQLGFQ